MFAQKTVVFGFCSSFFLALSFWQLGREATLTQIRPPDFFQVQPFRDLKTWLSFLAHVSSPRTITLWPMFPFHACSLPTFPHASFDPFTIRHQKSNLRGFVAIRFTTSKGQSYRTMKVYLRACTTFLDTGFMSASISTTPCFDFRQVIGNNIELCVKASNDHCVFAWPPSCSPTFTQ
jgi:hypothetical protein